MIDIRKTIVSELNTIGVPVYAEHYLTENSEVPCISYRQSNSIQNETGEHLMYSKEYINVKVWAKSMKDITELSIKVDKIMRSIGCTRIATNELWLNEICQYELKYNANALEIMED